MFTRLIFQIQQDTKVHCDNSVKMRKILGNIDKIGQVQKCNYSVGLEL